jgi:hypothetical protein
MGSSTARASTLGLHDGATENTGAIKALLIAARATNPRTQRLRLILRQPATLAEGRAADHVV